MQPEDRLDALLALPRAPAPGAPASDAGSDPELAPLLDAARQVRALAAARPDPRFAEALRARMLARAAELRVAQPARSSMAGHGPHRLLRTVLGAPTRQSLVAAAVLLAALGAGTLTVAAAAPPGSPLFGLHRAEQGIRVAAARDSGAQTRLHLQYARQWLAAVHDAAAQQHGGDGYLSALQALREEDGAATGALAAMPAGPDRQALEGQLAHLRADESATLGAALASIGWPARIPTTQALDALGVSVLHVASAKLAPSDDAWRITITGAGFQPGAVLLVDGQAVAATIQVSATQLTARLPRGHDRALPHTLGVGNPDSTAAAGAVTLVSNSGGQDEQGTPGSGENPGQHATPTAGGDDHHGDGGGTPGPGDDHGHGTPTTTPHP
jgi:hypothetical protein